MPTSSILGLSHVSLSVRDRTAALDFWTRVMGFDVVADEDAYCFVFDRDAGLAVILTDHHRQVADGFDERRAGLDHLAYAVADVTSLRVWGDRLTLMGVPHSEISETDAGHHLNLRAPDDLPIELFVMKRHFADLLGVDVAHPAAHVG
jgi:catechol 2,3-dioxygenase-like lactoylglutathione lyase family enzyme